MSTKTGGGWCLDPSMSRSLMINQLADPACSLGGSTLMVVLVMLVEVGGRGGSLWVLKDTHCIIDMQPCDLSYIHLHLFDEIILRIILVTFYKCGMCIW